MKVDAIRELFEALLEAHEHALAIVDGEFTTGSLAEAKKERQATIAEYREEMEALLGRLKGGE